MPHHSGSGLRDLTPSTTLTPAAKRFLFAKLGEQWVTRHTFAVGDKVTLKEARYLLPWLKKQQEEERRQVSPD